ncbi:MAG TPA: STAS domain-containing protein [Casimicrobiaceae bacterium]|jgi:anti-sigma B factor antagonist/stage II sporulation protein AA (anti-sigma F factor antagonist)|nr:STAS domain-containing protein [Casimicrobiaceae bacterium]
MDIASHRYADVAVVAPLGRLDYGNAGDLERTLAPLLEAVPTAPVGVVIDCAGIDYISSIGLRALLIAAKAMRARSGRIAAAGLQPVVAEIFAISRFQNVVEVFDTPAAALASMSAAALAAFETSTGAARS